MSQVTEPDADGSTLHLKQQTTTETPNFKRAPPEFWSQLRPWNDILQYFPPLTPNENRQLRAGLERFRYSQTILAFEDGRIIDGLQRFQHLQSLNQTCDVFIFEGTDHDAFSLRVNLNLGRRHLSREQIEEIHQGMRRDPKRQQIARILLDDGNTQRYVAALTGYNVRTIRRWVQPRESQENHGSSRSNVAEGAESGHCPPFTSQVAVDNNETDLQNGDGIEWDEEVPIRRISRQERRVIYERVTGYQESIEEVAAFYQLPVARIEREVRSYTQTLARLQQQREENAQVLARMAENGGVDFPRGPFACIVIDPPWPMERRQEVVPASETHELPYPTMSMEDIRSLPVLHLADPAGCFIFLWTTQNFMPEAFSLFQEWRVTYLDTLVWNKVTANKQQHGMQTQGNPKYNCEFVLRGQIGSPSHVTTKEFPACFTATAREHSRKPTYFYDLVRRVCEGPRLEMFSRERHPNFDQHGLEINHFPPRLFIQWERFVLLLRGFATLEDLQDMEEGRTDLETLVPDAEDRASVIRHAERLASRR